MQPFRTNTSTTKISAFLKINWNRFQSNKATRFWGSRVLQRTQKVSIGFEDFLQTLITRFLNVSSSLRSTLLQRCSFHSSCKVWQCIRTKRPCSKRMILGSQIWLVRRVSCSSSISCFGSYWVNVLLGFTNLIPMVPFDGGHMFKDMVHAGLSRIRALGKKLKLWNFHPLWIDQISRKASNFHL